MSDQKPYVVRVTRLTVLPEGEPIFCERATHVEIEDESGGEFIRIHQDDSREGISIDPCEWASIKAAVETLMNGSMDYAVSCNATSEGPPPSRPESKQHAPGGSLH